MSSEYVTLVCHVSYIISISHVLNSVNVVKDCTASAWHWITWCIGTIYACICSRCRV